ncbi:F-box protein [Dorcoceras hygrometricum]|uniref:F-box protein n=1 Tax=Dorcoceras hygrometricum TaxID=472368 RepID=A0A2Z7C471_9LAMI|nr:F-box protein [Dorcoceras hygrometricum]
MSLFDLQDVCIAIGSLATLDLPMVVDLIQIYVLKGPYLRIDGGRSIPVVDRIGGSTAAYSLKCRFPRETGRSQAPKRQQEAHGWLPRSTNTNTTKTTYWKLKPRLGTRSHYKGTKFYLHYKTHDRQQLHVPQLANHSLQKWAFRQLPCWRLAPGSNRNYKKTGAPRPEGRLLRQPALEGLTRSARTDSPRKVGRNEFRRGAAAAAAACEKGKGRPRALGLGDTASRGPTTIVAPESQFRTCTSDHDSIGYPRMSASGESSTTMHRLLHASGSHPIQPPDDPNAPPPPPLLRRKIISGQFNEENPYAQISSRLIVQGDEGVSYPVVDRIGVIYHSLP